MILLTNKAFIETLAVGSIPTASLTVHSFIRDPSTGGNWTAYHQSTPLNTSKNNYVSVSSFEMEQGVPKRRRINFKALHCVMIDDLGTKLPMSDLKLKPTALIETSPGNFQAYLFLSAPITDIDEATRLIDAMVDSGISSENDPGMRGVTRVGRLPEGHNTKKKYGQPFKHITHEWNPTIRYSKEQIIEAYELILAKKARGAGKPPVRVTNGWDWVIDWMKENTNLHIAEMRPGYHKIICPWFMRHTDEVKTGTYYMEPTDENKGFGGFICHHGSCSDFHAAQFNAFITRRKTEKSTEQFAIPQFITEEN